MSKTLNFKVLELRLSSIDYDRSCYPFSWTFIIKPDFLTYCLYISTTSQKLNLANGLKDGQCKWVFADKDKDIILLFYRKLAL